MAKKDQVAQMTRKEMERLLALETEGCMHNWTRMIISSRRSVLDVTFLDAPPLQSVKIGDITRRGPSPTRPIPSRVATIAFDKKVPWVTFFSAMPPHLKSEVIEFVGFILFFGTILERGQMRRSFAI